MHFEGPIDSDLVTPAWLPFDFAPMLLRLSFMPPPFPSLAIAHSFLARVSILQKQPWCASAMIIGLTILTACSGVSVVVDVLFSLSSILSRSKFRCEVRGYSGNGRSRSRSWRKPQASRHQTAALFPSTSLCGRSAWLDLPK